MPAHQSSIASILCTHFYVDCVSRSQYDAGTRERYKVLEILGSVENVQIAEYVYWYLWRELPLLWKSYSEVGARQKRRASQRSFYLGVLNGFHDKLSKEKTQAADAEPSSIQGLIKMERSLDLMLRKELKSFVQERFPRLNRGGSSRGELERDAYHSGVARGQTLELRQGLTQNHKQLALSSGRNS